MTPSLTTEQKLAAIRAKCVEANPEIATRAAYGSMDKCRLADVLLCEVFLYRSTQMVHDGGFCCITDMIVKKWNLRQDSLDAQSEATISFLHSLLSNE